MGKRCHKSEKNRPLKFCKVPTSSFKINASACFNRREIIQSGSSERSYLDRIEEKHRSARKCQKLKVVKDERIISAILK